MSTDTPTQSETRPFPPTTTAEEFNAAHPIGTPVLAWPGWVGGRTLWTHTRSEAWVIGQDSAVVAVEGHPGGIALTHVMPIPEEYLQ